VVPAKPPAASKAPPRETSDDPPDIFKAVETALTRHDFKAADALAASVSHAVATRPDYAALLAWVGAHSGDDDALPESVRALTRVLEENPKCQPALYYRGMLLKRAGKDKAALRDFVTLLYENPTHLHALSEVRDLRKKNK
jgi:lipoprotein NlpI